jgi:membrane protein involved in D-alanine export
LLNFYTSLQILEKAAVAVLVFRMLLPWLPNWLRQVLLLGISVYFVSCLSGFERFGGPLAFCVLVVVLLGWFASRGRTAALALGCCFMLGVLLLCKYPQWFTLLSLSETVPMYLRYPRIGISYLTFQWIGISYLTFKAIDYCVTMRSSKEAGQQPLAWLYGAAYLMFFPVYVAGPINRFTTYLGDQTQAPRRLTWPRLRADLMRVSLGIIKILFCGKIAFDYCILAPGFLARDQMSVWTLAGAIYCYYLYLYFDFSGYCDAAIALADLFEVPILENFRYPFLASSPQDFWNRWHISLAQWLRDMVFFRVLRALMKRLPWIPFLVAAMISIFVTFVLMGVWHGDSLNWLLYGCYHGLALSLGLAYQSSMEALAPDLYQRLADNKVYRSVCVFLTFNFVAWGLLLTIPLDGIGRLLHRLTW